MKQYVHYGNNQYDPARVQPIKNRRYCTKPAGGFWASAVDAPRGWRDYCEGEEYEHSDYSKAIYFTLVEDARVLTIDSEAALRELPIVDLSMLGLEGEYYHVLLDFERLTKDWDAIEVMLSADSQLYSLLLGWDCDSILIMNLDVVVTSDIKDMKLF